MRRPHVALAEMKRAQPFVKVSSERGERRKSEERLPAIKLSDLSISARDDQNKNETIWRLACVNCGEGLRRSAGGTWDKRGRVLATAAQCHRLRNGKDSFRNLNLCTSLGIECTLLGLRCLDPFLAS